MGEIHVHEFISLDGVVDTPTWTAEYPFTPEQGEATGAIMGGCEALLLGRVTYEMFEPAWSARSEADAPGAAFFNGATKHVVSGTLTDPTWRNTEVLGPYGADAIAALKARTDGGLYVSGSATLVRALLDDGLVDALHLFTYPLTRGAGPRLFADGDPARALERAGAQAYDNGVLYAEYRPASEPS